MSYSVIGAGTISIAKDQYSRVVGAARYMVSLQGEGASFPNVVAGSSLNTLLESWGWEAYFASNGNLKSICYVLGSHPDVDSFGVLWTALCPFIKRAGKISVLGEDGCYWEWRCNVKGWELWSLPTEMTFDPNDFESGVIGLGDVPVNDCILSSRVVSPPFPIAPSVPALPSRQVQMKHLMRATENLSDRELNDLLASIKRQYRIHETQRGGPRDSI